MASRIVFSDDNGNEMDCYLNEQGMVYVNIGNGDDDPIGSGYITLDKSDVGKLINVLKELEEQMAS